MKALIAHIIAAIFLSACQPSKKEESSATDNTGEQNVLLPYYDEEINRWGFINQHGSKVIPARYRFVERFSEGVSAVSEEGLYGMIDSTGKYVIPPIYDFCEPMNKGMAVCYIWGRPLLRNKEKVLIDTGYSKMKVLKKDRVILWTSDSTLFLANTNGKKMTEAPFKDIIGFNKNFVMLTNHYVPRRQFYDGEPELGVVLDYEGNEIHKSFMVASDLIMDEFFLQKANGTLSIIGNKGKTELILKEKEIKFFKGQDYCTVMYKAEGVTYLLPKSLKRRVIGKGKWIPFNKTLLGKLSGDVITALKSISGEEVRMPNTRDKYLGFDDSNYKNERQHFFKLNDLYHIVIGNRIIETRSENPLQNLQPLGPCHFACENSYDGTIYVVDPYAGEVIRTYSGHKYSMLLRNHIIVNNGSLTLYISAEGDTIFRTTSDPIRKEQQDWWMTEFNEGHFYAKSSISDNEMEDLGGWAPSDNKAKKKSTLNGKLEIVVDSVAYKHSTHKYMEYTCIMTNGFQDTVIFQAQDSRLYMLVQAQMPNGQWKAIEYLPSSWCGNSYHALKLLPMEQWEFFIPKYEGVYKTKLRVRLMAYNKRNMDRLTDIPNPELYSNEWEGSINPGQTWRKPYYSHGGLMDPYND